jgi:hypothetical protein
VAFQKTKVYNSDVQIWAMKQLYPHFKSKKREKYDIEFTGTLKVKLELPTYTVSIQYRGNKNPIVKVISPALVENAPHIYPTEKNLCLYHPSDFNWQKEKLIANEIMDWTAAWIYFYEVWLQTGKWYGPEAPHNIPKTLNDE